jgi:LDH2 family malate/lactate/ureidoglycolate dehydrogenase
MPAPYEAHRRQIELLLAAWGMPPANAARTAEVMAWADLHGIDSHGISMIPPYRDAHRAGRVRMDAAPRIERETPVSALIDGDGGLGYVPSRMAMEAAIERARGIGIGAVGVRNSGHVGACGFYAKMASDAGMIGFVTTATSTVQAAPTGSTQPILGTDPIAFAAPTGDDEPFLLDMATTTVAYGRVRNKANEGLLIPLGWVLTRDGVPSTDPHEIFGKGGTMTLLGGSPEGGSHKGYGLAVMVNILSSCLTGAALITDPGSAERQGGRDIGHFFLALRPTLFREEGAFEADVRRFRDTLRGATPMDAARPVQVAGDPERVKAAARQAGGIPVATNLLATVRAIAAESGVEWLLGDS